MIVLTKIAARSFDLLLRRQKKVFLYLNPVVFEELYIPPVLKHDYSSCITLVSFWNMF
jgi:hypothetical protein